MLIALSVAALALSGGEPARAQESGDPPPGEQQNAGEQREGYEDRLAKRIARYQGARRGGSDLISGLASSIQRGGSDEFTVGADGLNADFEYRYSFLLTTTGGSGGIGFNRSCSFGSEAVTVPQGNTEWSTMLTLYACREGNYTLTVRLFKYSIGEDEEYILEEDTQDVTVIEPTPTTTPDVPPVLPSVSDRTYEVGDDVNLLLPRASGGNPPLSYSVDGLPSTLRFSPSTRRITGRPARMGVHTVNYSVRDDDGDTDLESFTITIEEEDTEPSLPSITDRTYEVGDDVNLLLPRASGGNPPLAYSVSGLPSTLRFSSSTRRITGTPSRAATHAVTYSVRDDDGDTDSETFTLTIEPAPPPPTPDPPELDAPPAPDGVSASTINQDNILLSWDLREGVEREQVRYRIKDSGPWPEPVAAETIIFASRDARGTGRYTSRIAGLDPDTTYEFEVQSYGDGARWQAAWGPWSGTVEDTTFPAPTLSIAVPDGGLEADGSTDITVNVGELAPTLAYRLSIATGTHTGFDDECAAPVRSVDLPVQADRTSYAWPLTLHGCSVGTDTLTARLYEVHEENDETERATAEETVRIACPVLDFGEALVTEKSWTQNTPITPFTLPEASGCGGDLTHTLNPDLPSGVQLSSSTRRVSGTPTAAMARTEYTWTARDTGGAEASLTFYVTVPPVPCGPTFGNASVSDQSWKQNTRITPFTLPRATGENCALTYTLNPDLPSGVQLSSSTRRVSGTPTAAMARTEYTWTARDTGGAEASLTFYVTVPPDLEPTFGAASVPDQSWRQNVAITPFTLPRASGGDGTLAYTLSPDLPSGVTLNANTRRVSGTPTGTMDETGYTWTAEDEDGDTATLTFDITVALVPLPPRPDGVSASTINQDNILLSWDLREGIAREHLRYRIKDSGPWPDPVDASTIIFASRTTRSMHRYESLVRGLDPDTTYEFEVQSYGDGARWQAAWGPWSGTVEDTTFPAPTLSIAVPDGGLEADGSVGITVNAGDLAPTLAYRLSIGAGVHTGFDAECAAPVRSVDLPVEADRTSYAWPLTLHGCSVGTDTLTARLYEVHEDDSETERTSVEAEVRVCEPLSFQGASILEQEWTQDDPITAFTLPETSGGCGAPTYKLTPGLPSGVTLNERTLLVSGTPTVVMERTEYTWTAVDEGEREKKFTFHVTVREPLPAITIEAVQTPLASGGYPEFRFTANRAPSTNLRIQYEVQQSGDEPVAGIRLPVELRSGQTTTTLSLLTHDNRSGNITVVVQPGMGYITGNLSSATVAMKVPEITITASDPDGIVEGDSALFTLNWDIALSPARTVNIGVTEEGSFLISKPSSIYLLPGTTSHSFFLSTINDDVFERHGAIRVAVSTGVGYGPGEPDSARVPVFDNDSPTAPSNLRVNGNSAGYSTTADRDTVTLRWNGVEGITDYEVRYAEEVCTNIQTRNVGLQVVVDARCVSSGSWQTMNVTVSSESTAIEEEFTFVEEELTFERPKPLSGIAIYNDIERGVDVVQNPLYRVQVRAGVSGVRYSNWSTHVLVYPSGNLSGALSPETAASFPVQERPSGEYQYTICTGTFASVDWDADRSLIAQAIEDGVGTWEHAVRWVDNDDSNIIVTTPTQSSTCPMSEYVKFIPENQIPEMCGTPNTAAYACASSASMHIRNKPAISTGYSSWSDRVTGGRCTLLHAVTAHEMGHYLGVSSNSHSHLPNTMMYFSLSQTGGPYCTPQPHDVAAAMAQFQSR